MKAISKFLIPVIIIITIVTASIIAYADQENNLDGTCLYHEYQVNYFNKDTGVATLKCIYCDNECEESFESHINEQNYKPLDLNNDNIVNAKDFAYLTKNFQSKASTN